MKRALAISVFILVLSSLTGNGAFIANHFHGCAALGFTGHFHYGGDGISRFHYHPVSKHGSIIEYGQSTKAPLLIHQVRDCSAKESLNTAIPLIPDQGREIPPNSLAEPVYRATFIYSGLNSGGLPL